MTAPLSRAAAEPEAVPGAAAFEALLHSLPDLAWLKDRECRYLAINDAFLRQLRRDSRVREGGESLERDAVVGRTDEDLFPPPVAREYRAFDLRVQCEECELRARIRTPHSDGTSRWLDLTLSPFRDRRGRVLGTLGTARDVTDSAEREATNALAVRVAAAVHELSNPLNAIQNFAQLMLLDRRPADDAEALSAIRHEAERAGAVLAALREALALRATSPTPPAPRPGAPLPAATFPAFRSLRVLVVDDEPSIRLSVQSYLRRRGHRVDSAADGAEALARVGAAGSSAYDLVLCDLRMPGCSGDQLLDRLRERDHGLEGRVVFLTGDAEDEAFRGALRRSPIPPVLKPVQLPELARIVEGFGPRGARPA